MSHGTLKAKIPTFKSQALELGVRKQFANVNLNFYPTEEDRNLYDVGYIFNERVSATLGLEYIPTNSPEFGTTFLNFGATYKTGSLTARGFLGKTSGGTLCSGGVCRTVPPYTGALLELSASL